MSERRATPASFAVGDVVPAFSLPDGTGGLFDLAHQSIAGLHRLLVLGGAIPTGPALEAARARARAAEAVLVLVSDAPQAAPAGAGTATADAGDGTARLLDPERRLFEHLGLPAGGVAWLTPRGRLGAALAGPDALERALSLLPEPVRDPPVRRGGAPVLLVPEILEPALVAALLRHWEAGEKRHDGVASDRDATAAVPHSPPGGPHGAPPGGARIKRRADVPLDDRALYAAFRDRVARRVLPELQRAFRFRAASFEAPRIGCYDAAEAGAFGAHRDNRTPFTAHRRFAMSLNLNAGDYEGGRLRFPEFGPEHYEPGTGGAAIFGCDLLHEAMPVTRGRRFAAFTFFTDEQGARQEQEMIRQRQAQGTGQGPGQGLAGAGVALRG